MRYLMVALLSVAFVSPLLVGCDSDSQKTKTTTHNPITGTEKTTESTSSNTHTNNP